MSQKVAIVILNYKNYTDTIECLQAVYDIEYDNYTVIVVDNHSQNDSLRHVEDWLETAQQPYSHLTQAQSVNAPWIDVRTVLIQSDSNLGYAAGNNIGIRWAIRAGSQYVMILNNDTIVQKDFLEPLVDFLDTQSDTAMAGPKILDLDGNTDKTCTRRRIDLWYYLFVIGIWSKLFPGNYWHRRHYYTGEYDFSIPRQVDVISGSCMLIRSNVLKQIGLLDEKPFLYLEEFILSDQLRRIRMQTHIIPSSLIVHKVGQSIKKQNSMATLKIKRKSRNYYLKEYLGYGFLKRGLIMFDQRLLCWIRSIMRVVR